MAVKYIADLHLDRAESLAPNFDDRGFEGLEEQFQEIKRRWNSTVEESDDVYLIGDTTGSRSGVGLNWLLRVQELKGRKHLIKGNHETELQQVDAIRFQEVANQVYVEIVDLKRIEDNGRSVLMFHYPMSFWGQCDQGSFHLHGHLHSYIERICYPRRYNCFCKLFGYAPKTLDEIIEIYGQGSAITDREPLKDFACSNREMVDRNTAGLVNYYGAEEVSDHFGTKLQAGHRLPKR